MNEMSLPNCPKCGGPLRHAADRDYVVCRNETLDAGDAFAPTVACGYELSGLDLLNARTKGVSPFASLEDVKTSGVAIPLSEADLRGDGPLPTPADLKQVTEGESAPVGAGLFGRLFGDAPSE